MRSMTLSSKMLLCFVLPLAVGYHFLALPQMKKTAEARASVKELRQSTAAVSSAKQREEYRAKAVQVQEKALGLMPVSDDQYDLSVQVEALAKANNLTIGGLTINAAAATVLPKTTPPKDDVPTTTTAAATPVATAAPSSSGPLKVQVTASVVGGYADTKKFVTGLTTLERFVQVDQVSITAAADGRLTTSIVASAYYLPAQ
ncbi:MAG: type 4a pilus biogenesis protein PilO [Candidatus Paceibacterota bacterium]